MKIWSSLRKLAAFSVVALGLTATMASTPAQAQDYKLLTPGTIKCAFTGAYAPFSMQTADGKWSGLTVDVFKEMATRAGFEIEYVITKWDSLLVGLMAGQFDMLCATMDLTKERQERVLFVDGWLESGGRLVVHTDSPIQTLEEFEGKTMGVLVSSTWAELAKGLNPGETKFYQSESEAMRDVADGKIDGIVTDSIAAAWAGENAKMPLRLVPGYLSHIQKGFAATKDKVELVKVLNKALAEMIADGTYEKLTASLIGYSPAPAEPIKSLGE